MSNPEASTAEALALRGDAVGGTMYSESWILKLLMRLNKLISGEGKFDASFEEELCILWDMSVEEDVALFIFEYDFITVVSAALTILTKPQASRLREILLGILVNLCSLKQAREKSMERIDLQHILIQYMLSVPDTQSLIQVAKLLQWFAFDVRNNVVVNTQERPKEKRANSAFHDRELKDSSSLSKVCEFKEMPPNSDAKAGVISVDSCDNPVTSVKTPLSTTSDTEILSVRVDDSDDDDDDDIIVEELEVCKVIQRTATRVHYESVTEDKEIQFLEYSGVIRDKSNDLKQLQKGDSEHPLNDEVDEGPKAGSNNCGGDYDDCVILDDSCPIALEEDITVYSLSGSDSDDCVISDSVRGSNIVRDGGNLKDLHNENTETESSSLYLIEDEKIIQDGGTIDSDSENPDSEHSGSQIVTKDDSVLDAGIISSDDDGPEIIAIVRGGTLGFFELWYEQFLKVGEWVPQIIFILQNSTSIELIREIWTLLATLCFVRAENSYLGCRMVSSELLFGLFASFDEYFGLKENLDDLKTKDVGQCRSGLIEWTTVLYSFTFSEDSLRLCSPFKGDIMDVIFKMFQHVETFGQVDAKLLEWISDSFSILESFIKFELAEVEIFRFGIKTVLTLAAVLTAQKVNGVEDTEVREKIEKFLRKVLQWFSTLETNGQIGELKSAYEELKVKFRDENGL